MTDTFYVATVNFIDKNRKWNTSVAGVYLSIADVKYAIKKWAKENKYTLNFLPVAEADDFIHCEIYPNNSTEESIYISAETYYLNEAFPEGF